MIGGWAPEAAHDVTHCLTDALPTTLYYWPAVLGSRCPLASYSSRPSYVQPMGGFSCRVYNDTAAGDYGSDEFLQWKTKTKQSVIKSA